jgi:hypothetical protein
VVVELISGDAGVNVQVDWSGSPVQESVIVVGVDEDTNAAEGVRETVAVADWPAVSEAVAGETAVTKLHGLVISTSTVEEDVEVR